MRNELEIALALAIAPAIFAQTAPTPPSPADMAQHEVQRYTTLLSLNSEQEQQALSIFTAEATAEQSVRAGERTTRQALEAGIKADNTSAISQAAATLGQLNGQATLQRATAQAKFYQLLTADQQSKFDLLEKDRRGFGGPRHAPPPPGE